MMGALPLWLPTPAAGTSSGVQWRAPGFLRHYVAAELRERGPHVTRSLAMRLPAWMTSAKHRDEVLGGIRRLEGLLLRS